MFTVATLLFLTSIANIFLGLLVYLRNSKNLRNVFFFMLATSVAGWALGLSLFLTSDDQNSALFWGKIFYLSALFISVSLFLFATNYRTPSKLNKKALLATLPALFFAIYILIVPEILTDEVVLEEDGNEIILNSAHYLIYSILFLFYFCYAVYELVKVKKLTKNKELLRQMNVVITSLVVAGIFGVAFNLLLPWLGNYRLIWVGPLFSVIFVSAISYSIVRYRLFNFKLLFTRTLAYILTIIILIIFYIAVVNSASSIFFEDSQSSDYKFLYLFAAILAGLLFQPLKNFFDRVTNKIFYRDHYEIQIILDELGDVIVAEIEIDDLMTNSLAIIEKYLKPSSGLAVLLDEHGEFYDDFNINKPSQAKPNDVLDLLNAQKDTIIIADEYDDLTTTNIHDDKQRLVKFLNKHDVSMSVMLSTKEQIVGYLLMGPKLSGNTYNREDIQFLNIAASELAVSIQNARRFDEIQRFNETLRLEVERATKEMRESNKKLRELDEAKDEFITMASHQLRTPLTSVKGYVSMVMEEDVGKVNPKQKDLLTNAYSSAQRMVYLIGDLLNASRLKTGKFIIDAREVNLPKIIDSEIVQLKATAKTRDIKLVFNKPKDFPPIMLDENKIRQVIMNYIDNAIYYTKAKGKIVIDLSFDKKKVELRVTDSGIGVPTREKHKLFTKFYRAENAKAARPDGTGLGLFMAKKVVVAQGGAIIFESTEGKGSTFGFSFPLSRVGVKKEKETKKSKKKPSAAKRK